MTQKPEVPKVVLAVLSFAWLALIVGGTLTPAIAAAANADSTPAAPAPVIVELFTSQGCSSCPPADRLLTRLLRDPKLANEVIPLAFHVDYWDQGGWTDPFSSHEWTVRQEGYAQAFHASKVYTPQLVVNGRTECVGSQEQDVRSRIDQALDGQAAAVVSVGNVTVATPPSKKADGSATVKVSARVLHSVGGNGLDLWVAVVENGLVTSVKGGENASATLHDDHVVRHLVKALTMQPTPGAEQSADVTLSLPQGGELSSYSVAAFLQDPQTRAIQGGAMRSIAAH